ncbi:hypothetical protein [Mycobacterium lepromatosis]|uniref:hypothetical protein n=1 Tax=Mycobacterium lepromatosis TaxID=480418 RepID=UPI000AB12732|nr:hypothetical protein [Mycobacterium lepromatosis]
MPSAWRATEGYILIINVKAFEATVSTVLDAGDTAAGLPGTSSSSAVRSGVVPRYDVELIAMSFPLAGG